MKKVLAAAVVGILFGLFSGILGVWVDHRNENATQGPRQDRWSDLLVIPSLPGNFITWRTSGAKDWCIDEDWSYRKPIAIWNALFWCGIFSTGAAIWVLAGRMKRHECEKRA